MSVQRKARFVLVTLASLPLCGSALLSPAMGQTQTRDGAVVGGVAGAVIGGIIGHQNKETPEGALIGGAVGAVAGGLIGNQREQAARQRYYQQQHYHQSQRYRQVPVYTTAPVYATPVYGTPVYTTPVYGAPVYTTAPVYTAAPVYTSTPVYTSETYTAPQPAAPVRAMCVSEVITLTKNGISETVIANQIHSIGLAAPISTDDVLALHDAGVSDFLITEMQNAPLANTVNKGNAPVYTNQGYSTQGYSSQRQAYRLQPVPTNRKNF